MRVYIHRGPPGSNDFPILLPGTSREWKRGERAPGPRCHWGDEMAIFVDGECKVRAPFKGTLNLPLG